MRLQCVIVDANEPFRKVARRMLERQGMAGWIPREVSRTSAGIASWPG
jgi:hypothetical protein